MFIVLLSFSRSLETKCVSSKNKPCITRLTLIDLNPAELNCYPFMMSLDKCNGSCDAVDDLHAKIYLWSEAKGVNVKVLNMITRISEAKALVKHLSFHCKCKFDSAVCNSNQKWNNKTCQCESKNYCTCKKRLLLES